MHAFPSKCLEICLPLKSHVILYGLLTPRLSTKWTSPPLLSRVTKCTRRWRQQLITLLHKSSLVSAKKCKRILINLSWLKGIFNLQAFFFLSLDFLSEHNLSKISGVTQISSLPADKIISLLHLKRIWSTFFFRLNAVSSHLIHFFHIAFINFPQDFHFKKMGVKIIYKMKISRGSLN